MIVNGHIRSGPLLGMGQLSRPLFAEQSGDLTPPEGGGERNLPPHRSMPLQHKDYLGPIIFKKLQPWEML